MQDLRDQFLEELRSIPNDEKQGYLKAIKKCQRLFLMESQIDHYLEMQGAMAKTCARKFVSYWNNRQEIYGEDHAFQHLHLL